MAGRKSIFSQESRVSVVMRTLWDLMKLNLLTLLCSLPLLTVGAAFTAMHAVLISLVRGEEAYIARDYFSALRENLGGATVLWLVKLAFVLPMGAQLLLLEEGERMMPTPVTWLVFIAGFAVLLLLAFALPLQAHFRNTILGTLENSCRLGIARFPRALVLALIWVLPVLLLLHVYALFPLVLFLGISLPGYLCCRLYEPVFRELDHWDGSMKD